MSSADDSSERMARVAALLRQLGVDETQVSAVDALLREPPSSLASHATVAAPHARGRGLDADVHTKRTVSVVSPVQGHDGSAARPSLHPLPGFVGESAEAKVDRTARGASELITGARLAAGGMGEVFRVHDPSLHRSLAMKVLLPEMAATPALRARFVGEAKVTAQLAHPGIPPVHELGTGADGRPYFTMKEVRGATLAAVVAEAHGDGAGHKWSEQRLLEIFQRVCDAVAYAHARGVVHCDLKPANIMVGAFGEVLVMDWGVARLVAPSLSAEADEPSVTFGERSSMPELVAGTPAYMAPEQAFGSGVDVGHPSDVYALGVILYELLCGEVPFRGTPSEILAQSREAPRPRLVRANRSPHDEALQSIVTRALAPRPEERYPDAKALADDVARWREGAMRREQALSTMREGQALIPEIEPALARAAELREEAERKLAELGRCASVEAKEPLWARMDEAAQLAQAARLRQVEVEQLLFNALAHAPDLVEAKGHIARLRFRRHREAEQRRAWDEAAAHELVLRAHDTGEFREYLEGTARLSVASKPRADVRLYRVLRKARRLLLEHLRDLGRTPILDLELPVGSYVLEASAEGHATVRYPVLLRRREAGGRKGKSEVFAIPLPRAEDVGPGEVVIAEGFTDLGGDDDAPGALRAERVWVDGFVMREHPVTYGELAPFLADEAGAPFLRGVVRDGVEVWRPDWPAVGVSWAAAKAYAAWLAARTGLPWRLPTEREWEKAARGVDGRFYPWGDAEDPAIAFTRTAERAASAPASIHAFAADVSPYGVRGMGGNVRDWCEDAADDAVAGAAEAVAAVPPSTRDASRRIVRGGSWRQPPDAARVAGRCALVGAMGYPDVAFRLARSI